MNPSLRRSTRLASASNPLAPVSSTSIGKKQIKSHLPLKRTRPDLSTQSDKDGQDDGPSAEKKPAKRRKTKDTNYNVADFPQRIESKWRIGPHVSGAGGVENTVVNAASIGATAFALFVKSQRKWTSPPLKQESVVSFKARLKEFGYSPDYILPHGSYLVNLGNPDAEKREKSYECFLDDLKRCEQLGLHLYNFHPGSTVGQAEPEESLSFIAQCINRAHKETESVVIVLENMAGSGNVLGSSFAQLGAVIEEVVDKSRVGVCLDTCHTFAAGYDIRTKEGWNETMDEFNREIGIKYLRGMHLNDSKAALNSKKDRHENIGIGHLSLSAFAHILTDPRTQNIPLILETPAFDGPGSVLAGGMDVWKKEVEVLNRISSSAASLSGSNSEVKPAESTGNSRSNSKDDSLEDSSKERLDEWTEEIRSVVKEASAEKDAKGRKLKPKAKGKESGKKRKVKAKKGEDESDEYGEDNGAKESCGEEH